MHWADFTAQRLKKERGDSQTLASGITPSGEIHLGNLREILTAEMIHRACLDAGLESRYIFIVDSMDPLRRVYPFLSDEYERYIGPVFYTHLRAHEISLHLVCRLLLAKILHNRPHHHLLSYASSSY